jgi:hypothetical protein
MRIGLLWADDLVLLEEAAVRRREEGLRWEEARKALLREEDKQRPGGLT